MDLAYLRSFVCVRRTLDENMAIFRSYDYIIMIYKMSVYSYTKTVVNFNAKITFMMFYVTGNGPCSFRVMCMHN